MEAQIFALQDIEDIVDNYQADVELFMCLRITVLRMQAVWQPRSGTVTCKHLNAGKEE